MNGWLTKGCALSFLALASTGCSLIQGPGMHQRYALQASSAKDEIEEIRILESTNNIGAVTEDAIVRVVGPSMTCTGTVIEDHSNNASLVLTAHHCLVERGPHGEFLKQTIAPTEVKVELGGDYFAWGEVGVSHIVTPPCGEGGGGGDIAVLVLKRKLVGLQTMTPRLEAPPKPGEPAVTFGFGRCALSGDAIRRKGREGGPVGLLTPDTLSMDAAVCPGDSGGPVFGLKGGAREIIGVVSLSAMDHDEKTRGASVMARVDAYRMVFANAHSIAEGQSPQELPPLSCNAPVAVSPRAAAAAANRK